MLKYRGKQLIRAGFMGVVLAILIIGVGLAPERLISWATAIRYQAQFADAGGVVVGNDVVISESRSVPCRTSPCRDATLS